MNYESSVRYLLSLGRELAAPTQAAAAKFDLENITILAERLGHPERAYPSVHIAGTNGKGSTAAFLESILRQAGFRTGLNTSPHLEKINERIRVHGEEINDETFADTLSRIQVLIEELLASGKLRGHPTYFECVTAMAFESFARERVAFGVFEVGLGGRLDATNILSPVVTIITRIDFDHENFLGHSLKEIAFEKAGILKPGVPLVLAEQRPEALEVILARARELACPVIEPAQIFRVDQESLQNGFARARVIEADSGKSLEIAPSLPGRFQLQNAVNGVAASHVLQNRGFRIPDDAITHGIANTVWHLHRAPRLPSRFRRATRGNRRPSRRAFFRDPRCRARLRTRPCRSHARRRHFHHRLSLFGRPTPPLLETAHPSRHALKKTVEYRPQGFIEHRRLVLSPRCCLFGVLEL